MCHCAPKQEKSSSGTAQVLTSKSARLQKKKSVNKRQSSGRCWTSFLNLFLYSDRVANVFMPTALGSITSGLVLKSGGKHPGMVFRPRRFFILMTENVRRALIPIMLAPVAPLSSWSCDYANVMALIAGSWFVLTHCATNRDRLRVGILP